MFTALVMWHMELKRMEDELSYSNQTSSECDPDELIQRAMRGTGRDDGFNQMVALLMSEDMSRTDGLYENMEHLQNEINEIEKEKHRKEFPFKENLSAWLFFIATTID